MELGAPRKYGTPFFSRYKYCFQYTVIVGIMESDGTLNEDYCKWCYADGTYTYSNMDDLIDV